MYSRARSGLVHDASKHSELGARVLSDAIVSNSRAPCYGAESASTTSAGCTVTPLKPVYDHTNSSGNKVIKYETKVYCDAGRSIEILDERRDHDNLSLDDFEGSIIYNLRFDSAATVY